ncbi:MAG TPA: DUF2723 domain-containing protein, partial [Bacteroidota bacterium]|nr:DUF2723 domain-containing protein [Bacteroidota bacterium]
LFLLINHVVSMIPFFMDPAHRMHAVAAMSGAVGVTCLYLIGSRIITRYRGIPATVADRIVVYGSAAVGALSLAWSTSFWFNSTEAIVFSLSMAFVSLVVWLSVAWSDWEGKPHNERFIILIAYLVGLSIGVHLLSLLALFTCAMLFYFWHHEYTWKNFFRFSIASVIGFFIIYPGIVQKFPAMLAGNFLGVESNLWVIVPPALVIAALYLVWDSIKKKQKWINVAALSFLFIMLGYTVYAEVLIRSNAHPPMNENSPTTFGRLVTYLSREQYGETPFLKGLSWNNDDQTWEEKFFPRRYSQEGMHEPTRANYTSDGDFFWRYQVNHMFLRYVGQNFIGAESDAQDAGVSWKNTWGIPLFMGLFGFFYHWKRDWRNWLPFFAMFMVMGFAFNLYANMQEPQPRERDYFYVGAFYIFSLWIGLGAAGIADFVKSKMMNKASFTTAMAGGVIAVCAIVVPFNLLRMNYHERDRSGNFVAWDYSYNLLQSCDQDAILFTNGDNDTFPLWYLQDVEGIRTDVRIANLSLINTPWYIAQLKNETPHGSKKVPISLTDRQIDAINVTEWKSRTEYLDVPPDVQKEFGVKDSTILRTGKLAFTMAGVPYVEGINILRVQDIMVENIIKTNNWKRPIDFAVTCSPDSKIGLDSYLWMQGLTYRLEPIKGAAEGGVIGDLMAQSVYPVQGEPSKTYKRGSMYRNLNDPTVFYDENIQRMIMNYRAGFLELADYQQRNENNSALAKKTLEQMEQIIPLSVIRNQDWRYTYRMMMVANFVGDSARSKQYSDNLEVKMKEMMDSPAGLDNREMGDVYQVLLSIYDGRKDYSSAIDILTRMKTLYGEDQRIDNQIQMYQNLMKPQPVVTDTGKKH